MSHDFIFFGALSACILQIRELWYSQCILCGPKSTREFTNRMTAIKLNHTITSFNGNIEWHLLTLGLGMYRWSRSGPETLVLVPEKNGDIKSTLSSWMSWFQFFASALILWGFGRTSGHQWLFLLIWIVFQIVYWSLRIKPRRDVYRHLPIDPIAELDLAKRQLTVFRNDMPFVQIPDHQLTLNFDAIEKAAWESGLVVQNGSETIQCNLTMFSPSFVNGFYLLYRENGEDKTELVFCGRPIKEKIYGEIFDKCGIGFWMSKNSA